MVIDLTETSVEKDILSVPFYQAPSYSLSERVLEELAEKVFDRYERIGIKNPTDGLAKKWPNTSALSLFRALAQEMANNGSENFFNKFSNEVHAICMSRPNIACDKDINPIMLSEFFYIIDETRDK